MLSTLTQWQRVPVTEHGWNFTWKECSDWRGDCTCEDRHRLKEVALQRGQRKWQILQIGDCMTTWILSPFQHLLFSFIQRVKTIHDNLKPCPRNAVYAPSNCNGNHKFSTTWAWTAGLECPFGSVLCRKAKMPVQSMVLSFTTVYCCLKPSQWLSGKCLWLLAGYFPTGMQSQPILCALK